MVTRIVGPAVNEKKDSKMSNENQNDNGDKQLDPRVALTNAFPTGFQAIASAYGDYAKKSFEDTKAFVEKLSGVRSLDKAIEVQTEFAKTSYETFVTESQKIGTLYGDLVKQSYKPFGGIVEKMTPTNQ
ncbi:phasin family protein [Bradyrhizobium sp.]|uniref:phasin family protein n=1 Tax=Bradyrhizobium sp. TaxID=376 RepID=UPI0026289379|nr:phasin family protein [Bradyrhizobium sp.]